tara:strand:+ start:637 stop:1299 length:663 start_codon:yes stop_codon:yes gene_type:complete
MRNRKDIEKKYEEWGGEFNTDFHIARLSMTKCFWESVWQPMRNKPNLNFLEIGSFEGQSAMWFLEEILTHETSKLVCVDPHGDNTYDPMRKESSKTIYETFKQNILDNKKYKKKVTYHRENSRQALRRYPADGGIFDFAYIDGLHYAHGVLEDLVLTWPLVKEGGVIILDDFAGANLGTMPNSERALIGINSFLQSYDGMYEILGGAGILLPIRVIKHWR